MTVDSVRRHAARLDDGLAGSVVLRGSVIRHAMASLDDGFAGDVAILSYMIGHSAAGLDDGFVRVVNQTFKLCHDFSPSPSIGSFLSK